MAQHGVTLGSLAVARGKQAAERSRDTGKARALYTKLVSLCDQADTQRPELQQAKAFLRK
jgi:hypothetical protein